MLNEENIRISFKRAKDDIDNLKAEIRQIKGVLEEIKAELKALKEPPKSEDPTLLEEDFDQSSTGNEGVQSNEQTNEQTFTHSNIQSNTPRSSLEPKSKKESRSFKDMENTFNALTRQEFQIFLLIYQLEDEGSNPTYGALSTRLNLTSGCLRGYISSMVQKGVPLEKRKLRNNSIILTIDKEFKSFASREKLIDIYYHQIHPDQTKLS